MSLITNKNAENLEKNTLEEIPTIQPVTEANPAESERFSQLMSTEETENQSMDTENSESDELITLEELQQQFRDNVFRTGFNRTIERAKEIAKDMKE